MKASAPCMGRCDAAPAAEVGHRHVEHATIDSLAAAAAGGNPHPEMPAYQDLMAYRAEEGYARLADCLDGRLDVEGVIATLGESGLRGLGGAGFPAGRKWSFVRAEAKPRYLAVNADEGEPGTFKDRHYLERRPQQFLEGTLIAAWAVEAEAVYIYLRDEYPAVREILLAEIAAVEAAGLAAHTKLHLRRGAGTTPQDGRSRARGAARRVRRGPRSNPRGASTGARSGRPHRSRGLPAGGAGSASASREPRCCCAALTAGVKAMSLTGPFMALAPVVKRGRHGSSFVGLRYSTLPRADLTDT